MFRHHPTQFLTLAALAGLTSSACNPRPENRSTASAGDSAAAVESETGTGSAHKVGEASDFQNPESARWDPDQSLWFVSNVNGDPGAKDNNGYISRLKPDGTADTGKFIVGGSKGVTLNAPKGMAITGDTLWVADIDAVRAFDSLQAG